MIVENPDAFKAWMTTVLEPLCDADPQALAKYIYALVKKDKPTEELRKSMVAQLEVFLQKDTKPFVDFLFTKLETGLKEEYKYFIKVKDEPLEQQGESAVVVPEQPVKEVQEGDGGITEVNNSAQQEDTPQIINEVVNNVEEAPNEKLNDELLSQASQDLEIPSSPRPRKGSVTTVVKERTTSLMQSRDRKSDSERDDKERAYKVRRRNSSGSSPRRQDRSRSRSRSWDRNIHRSRSRNNRSRSRGRDRIRAWRNKSPPPRRYERKMPRSWSWSKSPGRRSRSRSRTRSRSRSRSPIHSKEWHSRYRNQSPFEKSPSGDRKQTPSPSDSPAKSADDSPPTQDSSTGDDLRPNQGIQNSIIQSVVNINMKEPFSKRSRCRDYEEKGFCMRGEMCPFDHGNDPVVLEGVGQVLSFSAPPPPSALEPPLGMPMMRPALSPRMTLHHPPHLMSRIPPNLSEYNPDAPSMEPRMWSKQQFRTTGRGMMRGGPMIRPPLMMPHHNRELISVPTGGENEPFYTPLTFSNPNKRPTPMDYSNGMEMPLKPRFDYSRLGNRRNNCSLQLKKIPPGLNNIAHLHNHFMKFGTIVNLQVNFEGDTEAALITFMSHAEASAAYKSTEAVLNNRFIKVFWYNPDKDDKQENISPAINRLSAKERLGVPITTPTIAPFKHKENKGNEKVIVSGANITKTFYISQEMDKTPLKLDPKNVIVTTKFQPSQELFAAKEAIKKKKEQIRQEAISKTQELVQRKRDFLDNLIKRQEELTEKYENGNFTPEQRCEILFAMKELHESIDSLRNGVGPVNVKPGPSAVVVTPQLMKKSIEQTKKEILDAELDLITKKQEGQDSAELNKTIYELKNKAHNLGKLVKKTCMQQRYPRGNTRFRTVRGGRGGYNPHSTVDHRPTKLLVSGFESDDKAGVLEHFAKFGEIVDHIWDEATPALVIQFKTRKDAEAAIAKGRNFQDRLMSVTWFNTAQNMGMRNSGMRSVMLLNDPVGDLMSEHDEEEEEALRINLDSSEDFLMQEEEEDEDEVRSWRR